MMANDLTPKRSAEFNYRCVRCQYSLQEAAQSLVCNVCQTTYPSIEGIKVLVANPGAQIAAYPRLLSDKRREIESKLRAAIGANRDTSPAEVLNRIESAYSGLLANLDLIEEQIDPIKQYLKIARPQRAFYGDFLRTGWPILNLLPYFYRDWYGTDEFRFLTGLFSRSINAHCGAERETVGVLGCAACGLVYEVAEFFDRTIGVEVGIDALLLARRLLEGGEATLHFNFPGIESVINQERVTLRGPSAPRRGIELIAADVYRLPFSSQSLSCILTQYLLDIVPNQKALASEVCRVLSPGGVWINFGLPLASAAGDLSATLDLPLFLEHTGFRLLEYSTHRYSYLDFSAVSTWAGTYIQTPVLFVARKNAPQNEDGRDAFAEYYAGEGERILTAIPRLRTDISVSRERRFSRLGVSERRILAIEKLSPERLTVSGEAAELAEWILERLTESLKVHRIIELFQGRYGDRVTEAELIEFFSRLHDWQFIEINEDDAN
jgi:ubiquinone/menaquinone biosynthesis C-methylase UbiE